MTRRIPSPRNPKFAAALASAWPGTAGESELLNRLAWSDLSPAERRAVLADAQQRRAARIASLPPERRAVSFRRGGAGRDAS